MSTDLKACEDELRGAYEFQKSLIDGSLDGIFATDHTGNIVVFNKGAEKIFGYTNEEVLGKLHVAELYPPGIGEKVKNDLESPEFGGVGSLKDYEITILTKGGHEVPVWLSASVIRKDEDVIGSIVIFRDLTRRKELEEKVLRSERLATLGRGIAYITHEIKNPLMAIGGFARQVIRSKNLDSKNKKKLRLIVDEIARLETFLADVTSITKVSQPEKFMSNINALIDELHSLMRHELQDKNITVVKSVDPAIPEIFFDLQQIRQVLINLIKNGIEAMRDGGELTLQTRLMDNWVEVVVADTGRGIVSEDLDRIFEPFFTSKERGTGLGLSISSRIVEDHGGTIRVEGGSEKGTRFVLRLPVR